MSQGYTYAPPTLDEAIQAYQRAKEKAKQVDTYSKVSSSFLFDSNQPSRRNILTEPKPSFSDVRIPRIRLRRRGHSQGSISELPDSENEHSDDDSLVLPKKSHRNHHKSRYRRKKDYRTSQELMVPQSNMLAWNQPRAMQYPQQPIVLAPPAYPYPNMPMYPQYNGMYGNPYPHPYMNSMPQYFYPPPHTMMPGPPHQDIQNVVQPQYTTQPAVPMNRRDFQRDCKYSPAPSRPYSDSDLLETLSTRSYNRQKARNPGKFPIVPPIKQMSRSCAAKVIQRNYRDYKKRRKVKNFTGVVKAKFIQDFSDKLIDDLLMEELLPNILIEVLLYGVKDIKLPRVEEGAIQEYADEILDECVYGMLRSSANTVMSEIIAVYSNKMHENKQIDQLAYVIDELIAHQIRETVLEFMNEYILDFQCERMFNQLVYEVITLTVYEEVRPAQNPEPPQKKEKVPFDLDNIILASILCRSLVPNDDYILDGIIAQGIANQIHEESKSDD